MLTRVTIVVNTFVGVEFYKKWRE